MVVDVHKGNSFSIHAHLKSNKFAKKNPVWPNILFYKLQCQEVDLMGTFSKASKCFINKKEPILQGATDLWPFKIVLPV